MVAPHSGTRVPTRLATRTQPRSRRSPDPRLRESWRPLERRPITGRKNVVDEEVEQADHRRVIVRDRRIVERELGRDAQLYVIVQESQAGRYPDLRKGLPRRTSDELVVVELGIEIHVA